MRLNRRGLLKALAAAPVALVVPHVARKPKPSPQAVIPNAVPFELTGTWSSPAVPVKGLHHWRLELFEEGGEKVARYRVDGGPWQEAPRD